MSGRPNILFIVADDMGYSDLGCYGGEIRTPHLDALAREGHQFTNFYSSPFCSPTRAMMLTGVDHHRAGFGAMREVIEPEQIGQPGYETHLNARVAALSELLRDGGYRTYLSGKWHLGRAEEHSPRARGFERSWGLIDGSSSHFDQTATASDDPAADPLSLYRDDGREVRLPASGFYSSEAYATRLIEWLDADRNDARPFFGYLAFTAPHFPLQAPDEFIARYDGRYRGGYEEIRRERVARLKQLGILAEDAPNYPGHPAWLGWDQLDGRQQEVEARHMAVYAAMIECMDHHIGRVLDTLRRHGTLDRTLVFFMSDNGAEGNSVLDTLRTREWVRTRMDNRLANRGRRGSFIEQGPGWAQVSSTPLRMYKSFTYDGGINVPALLRYPGLARGAGLVRQYAHVLDIVPTVLELAGIEHPAAGGAAQVHPLQGLSMAAFLDGRRDRIHPPDHVVGWEMQGRAALRSGNWKLVWSNPPWGAGRWELYDLAVDIAEQHDVASSHPDLVASLRAHWDRYVADNGVIFLPELAARMSYSNARRYYDDLLHGL